MGSEMVTIGIALLMFLTLPGELTSSPNFMLEKRAKQSYLEEDPLSITVENKASTATNITTEEKEKESNFSLKQQPSGNPYLEGPHVKLEGLESLKKESSVAQVPPEDKTNNFY